MPVTKEQLDAKLASLLRSQERLESQIEAVADQIDALNPRPIPEPPVGSVVQFNHTFGEGKRHQSDAYVYCAIRSRNDLKWYASGPTFGRNPHTWEEIITFADAGSLRLYTSWGRLD